MAAVRQRALFGNYDSIPTLMELRPPDIHSTSGLTESCSPITANGDDVNLPSYNLDKISEECGCCSFHPEILQKAVNAKCLLFWLSFAAFLQGVLVNGLVNVVITTIERRYHLSSSETGLIASSYDIASLICLLPVSYIGGSGNRSRWLAVGIVLVGFGGLLFSVPHYLSGFYEASTNSQNLCSSSSSESGVSSCSSSPLSRLRYFFIFGQLLHGAGSAPLWTIGISFLDDSVKPKLSSLYVGIYYSFSMLGPAVGFLLGSQFLRIYIDFDKVDSWPVAESHPVWLGAWWLGFLILGSCAILVSIPVFMFPASMPDSADHKAQRVMETHDDVIDSEATRPGFGNNIRDFPKAVKLLLVNLTYLMLNLAAAADSFVVMGAAAYGPKILQSQFGYSASMAAVVMGAATIPGGTFGTFLGGYLVKRLHLTCAGIIKFCMACSIIAFLSSFIFLIRCPDISFAGVNTPFNQSMSVSSMMIASCNMNCNCSNDRYDPVCSVETNTLYLTPCHAGCVGSGLQDEFQQDFLDCSCIASSLNSSSPVATRSSCTTDCSNLHYIFISVFAILIFFTFLASIPGVTATLRSVNDSQRPFAMGVQWVIVRLLGSVPGPLTFGILIDTVCTYWQPEPCQPDSRGRCLAYSNSGMSNAIFGIAILGKGLTMIFFFLAFFTYKPPSEAKKNLAANSSGVGFAVSSTPSFASIAAH